MKKKSLITLSLLLLLQMSIPTMAGHTKSKKVKKGILLVTFGNSYSNAQQTFTNIGKEVKKSFPNTEVRWAYNSVIIRQNLKKQKVKKDSPAMVEDGRAEAKSVYRHVWQT